MERRPIWLVGMMGAGKSAVGPLLANSLSRHFVDADQEIERQTGMTVAEIFATQGEQAFRERERELIESLVASGDVVALGGGAIAQPAAAARLARAGTVVYLKASPRVLLDRLGDCSGRPLLSDLRPERRLARLEALLRERAGAYESAAIEVDTEGRTVEAVIDEILHRLHAMGRVSGDEPERGVSIGRR